MLVSLHPASVLAQYPHPFPEQYTLIYSLQRAKKPQLPEAGNEVKIVTCLSWPLPPGEHTEQQGV